MIITDLSYLQPIIISDLGKVKGGGKDTYYDNKAAATALAYADGTYPNILTSAAAATSVYIDRGVSQAQSFSRAQSLTQN